MTPREEAVERRERAPKSARTARPPASFGDKLVTGLGILLLLLATMPAAILLGILSAMPSSGLAYSGDLPPTDAARALAFAGMLLLVALWRHRRMRERGGAVARRARFVWRAMAIIGAGTGVVLSKIAWEHAHFDPTPNSSSLLVIPEGPYFWVTFTPPLVAVFVLAALMLPTRHRWTNLDLWVLGVLTYHVAAVVVASVYVLLAAPDLEAAALARG